MIQTKPNSDGIVCGLIVAFQNEKLFSIHMVLITFNLCPLISQKQDQNIHTGTS